jgi:hypothetical protein
MTGSLEIKITISEFVTPALFQAMAAVSNPRQRAALLKRLAEDALRGNLTPAQAAPVDVVGGRESEAPLPLPQPAAVSESSVTVTQRSPSKPASLNEEEGEFDFAFLAAELRNFD